MSKKDLSKNYDKKTQYEHIVDLPDSYIGSIEKIQEELYIINNDTNKFIKKKIEFVPGLQRIYEEIILNAFDQQVRKGTGCNQLKIEVNREEGWVSVWNNGCGIPVQIHSEHKIWIPEMVFTNLLTSSNYKKGEKRITGGKNGYGAKLTNIFSNKFIIETIDAIHGKKYIQECSNNMLTISKPKITSNKNKPYTKITFYPDFAKFGKDDILDDGISGYSEDMVSYMKKRAIDIACCTKKSVSVWFNGEKIKIKTIQDYMKMYFEESKKIVCEVVNDRWTVGMCVAEDSFEQVSFVNGINTYQGGTHVNYITNKIVKEVGDIIKKKCKTVKTQYIKNKVFIFVHCFIENPSFNSQSKERLDTKATKFGSKCDLSQKFIKDVMKTGIKEEVLAFTEFNDNKNLKNNDGKKTKNIYGKDNYEKANWAGTKKSHLCKLIITEGLSAKGFAVNGLSKIGRDKYGIFPIKGKLINVKNATSKKVLENKEITDLKQILGLKQGMIFNSPEDFKQLRYGGMVILTDQDTDGSHIKGLAMNWIHTYWPSLLKFKFATSLATPILKAFKGKKVKKFYTISEYEKWKNKNGIKGWRIKYYKGLGTHTDEEATECFENFDENIIYYYDKDEEKTNFSMNLAFNNDKDVDKVKWSDKRKEWLMNYNPNLIIEQNQKRVKPSEFVNKELIHFSNDDTHRSLPSIMDGLKPSQRKILYSGLKRHKSDKKEMRVAEFSGYVTFQARYHHGEKSIIETVVKMAQTFVGANNVNYFLPNGNFGSRLKGGGDHASERYIHTNLNPLVLDIFNTNDDLVLDNLVDEGIKVEPRYYMPVIPMILVNGTNGIGTAFSSTVCSHRLEDVCKAIIDKMNGKPFPKLKPYFRGFQGQLRNLEQGKYETIGMYKIEPETNTIHICELPVGMWTDKYKKFIEDKISNQTKKKYITSYENYCTKNTIHFVLKLSSDGVRKYSKRDYEFILKDLNLKKSFSTNNMHLFNAEGVVHKFKTTNEILEYFYGHRKRLYIERKAALIKELNKIVEKLKAQVMFIRYYNQKKIIIRKKSKQELEDRLLELKFPQYNNDDSNEKSYNYLTNMAIISLTNERAKKLEDKYKDMEDQLVNLKNTPIEKMWVEDMGKLVQSNKVYNSNIRKSFNKEKDDVNKTRTKKSKKKKSVKKPKKKLTLELDI